MHRTLAGLWVVVLMVAFTGCAGSMESPAAMPGPMAQAGGSWSGYAGTGSASVPVSLGLTQTGSDVAGNINVAGRPDLSGAVVGTVQGNELKLRLQTGYGSLPTMTVTQEQIRGTLTIGPMNLRRVN